MVEYVGEYLPTILFLHDMRKVQYTQITKLRFMNSDYPFIKVFK